MTTAKSGAKGAALPDVGRAAPRVAAGRSHWRVNSVYWLSIFGLCVWTMFAASGWIPDAPPIQVRPFLFILLAACANLFFRSVEASWRDRHPERSRSITFGTLFVTVDLCLVAAGLRCTGGDQSPLWIIVFLVGVAETVLARQYEADFIRVGTILALYLGTVPSFVHAAPASYYLDLSLRTGVFCAVSVVTRRLRVRQEDSKLEIALLRAELGVAEERARLSREIHDGVGNSLAAAVRGLEFAARKLEKERPGAGDDTVVLLREEAQSLRDAMNSVRDWAFFTRPWSSRSGGGGVAPSAALTAEVERLSRRMGLPIEVTAADVLDALSDATRFTLMRITQEALTNAAKHASGATLVRVTLRRDGTSVTLTISDDGAGFDVATAGTGVGMSSMRERAEGAGGSFEIASARGTGTRLTVRLPAG